MEVTLSCKTMSNGDQGSARLPPHVFDLPADRIMCLLVQWFVLAGTIAWVADGWLFFADYAVLPCET